MENLLEEIIKEKIVVIIRGVERAKLPGLCEALCAGGIRFAEFTYNYFSDAETAACISFMREKFAGRLCVGAGTVLTEEQALLTQSAGGAFVISPNTDPAVIEKTKALGLLSIPGAMTPSEIVTAHRAGADIVKLFPAATLGPDYVRAVCAPLRHIPLMATGGITAENLPAFRAAGAVAFGVSGDILRPALIRAENFGEIARIARTYVAAAQASGV